MTAAPAAAAAATRGTARKRPADESAPSPASSATTTASAASLLSQPPASSMSYLPAALDAATSQPTTSSALQRIIKAPTTLTRPLRTPNALSTHLAKAVPAFLSKLYAMVNDPSTDGMIQWGPDGTTFLVHRHEDFARDVLPRFFKHNNFASFVRQLNMYGFHKIPHLQQGVLQTDGQPELWEFANPNFQRDQPDLLCLVSRKRKGDQEDKDGTSSGAAALAAANSSNQQQQQKKQQQQQQQQQQSALDVGFIISEIAAIKRHQLSISSDLKNIQRENQVLWTESVAVRERHQRQQETIDKILRFLSSIFSHKQKPLMNKRRRLLLEQGGSSGDESNGQRADGAGSGGGGSSQDLSDDDGDDDADNALQRIRELIQDSSQPSTPQPQSPFAHHVKLLESAPANLAESSSSTTTQSGMPEEARAEPNVPSFVPYTFPHQQLSNSPAYDTAAQNAHAVSDDIDLLQDHISSLVGLDLDDLGSLDVNALGAALAAQQQLLHQQQNDAGIKPEPLSAADLAMLQQYNPGAFDFSLYPGLNNTTTAPPMSGVDPMGASSSSSYPPVFSNADLSNALALFAQGGNAPSHQLEPASSSSDPSQSFQQRVAATFPSSSPQQLQQQPPALPPATTSIVQQPTSVASSVSSSALSDADIDDLLRVGNATRSAYSRDDLAGMDPEDFAFLDQPTTE
ncbi:stress-responsive transcription factor hsf1 [Geranomyces variabilis]|nr:stress-responsive transcription factor hsf1 [Geranomyces variabilis]